MADPLLDLLGVSGPANSATIQQDPLLSLIGVQTSTPSLSNQIPGGGVSGSRNLGKPDNSSFMDKVTGGIEASRALATGATTGALGYIGGGLGGLAGSIASDEFGTKQGVQRAKEAADQGMAQMIYQPKTDKGIEYMQNIAQGLENSGISGLPLGGEMATAGRLARPSIQQSGGSLSTDAYALKQLGQKVANTSLLPRINPETAQLADKANGFGIQLTPDMLSSNKFARIAGETAAKVPFSGAKTEANQTAFNQSLIKMIGGDENSKVLTPDVYDQALSKSGEKIGEIATKTNVPMDQQFSSALASNVEDTAKFHTEDVSNVVRSYVQELQNKAMEDGSVNGLAFRTLNSKLGRQIRGTTNGDLKQALSDVQESMMDALQRNIADPADLSALLDARKKYAIAKTVEPLVAKSSTGDISPAGLMARVTADNSGKTRMATGQGGDLGDLARVGQRFLKEPGSSNTAERNLIYGAMGGGAVTGAVMAPITTAGVYTAANLYNRLSPILARKMVQKSLPPVTSPIEFPMSLAEDSVFKGRLPTPQEPYSGLLSLANEGDAAYQTRGLPKNSSPLLATRAERSGVPDTQRLATTHDYPTMDFPLRQEVLQQPEIASAINDFRAEATRLGTIKDNAINPRVVAKAAADLATLEQEFSAGMKQLGISNAADAHGLNRPLYETGVGTRLPIKTTDRNR